MYTFTLELPDGRRYSVAVESEPWRWHVAFGEACRTVEADHGLPARSGIRCVDYSWHLVASKKAA